MDIQRSRYSLGSCATGDRQNDSKSVRHIHSHYDRPHIFGPSRVLRTAEMDAEMDQDIDTDSSSDMEVRPVRHQWSVGVTDLDSAAGR
jgi:hypothetical protein